MSVIGIDFGNCNSRVAAAGKGGVDVLLNGISKRDNATLVSFGAKERHVGESGVDFMVRNAKNTVTSAKRLIGMHSDAPALENEKKFLTCEVAAGEDESHGITFEVDYNNERQRFRPEQVVAMTLTQLKGIVAAQSPTGGQALQPSCVLSCPAYYTQNQKQALLNACEIADLPCLGLLHETTAAALDYGIFKSGEFPAAGASSGVYACFIDVGHSATTASLVCFYASEMKVIATCFDENLGTRDIDMLLLQHFREEILKKYRFDVFQSKKAQTRLMQSCQKIKNMLSANAVTSLSLECLYEEMDIHFPSFTRDEFEALISDFAVRYEALCKRIATCAQPHICIGDADISSLPVELIGGGSRIPIVKRITQSVFTSAPRATLNATESVSKGCAIHAAMLSPNFRVKEYKITDVAVYAAKIGYYSPISQVSNGSQRELYPFLPEDINKIVNILKVGDSLPKVLDVSFEREENFDLYTFYENSQGAEINRARVLPHQYLLNHSTVTNVAGDFSIKEGVISRHNKVKLRFKVSLVGAVDIVSAQVTTEYDTVGTAAADPADASAPTGEQTPSEPQGEGEAKSGKEAPQEKRIRKERKTSQAFIEKHPIADGIPPDAVIRLKAHEKEMCSLDLLIQRTAETRNALETCFYEYRYQIVNADGELHQFTPPADIPKFDQMCAEASAWLESAEGDDASLADYASRLAPMQAIVDSAIKKSRNFQSLPLGMQEFEAKLSGHLARLGELKSDTDGGWHTAEELAGMHAALQDAESWYARSKDEAASQPLHAEPILTLEKLHGKLKETERSVLTLLSKRRPPPPKPEPSAQKEETDVKSKEASGGAGTTQPGDMEVE
ncbi:heat shock protein [Perkinsela sp. CCAP 1560/4]|nr:heat shock protein [Perkinsela sp. CCAP 1560/4]|eukprot:KNH05462.1 heat shock protein [Perkinsela sp. CCAP 1560/4]